MSSAKDAENMAYIHELEGWPRFAWSSGQLVGRLAAVRHKKGRLIGRMERLGFHLRAEATLQTLTEEVVKSSEIEGEILDREQVRSSIARCLAWTSARLLPLIDMSKAWWK
jgi:Fic family protein